MGMFNSDKFHGRRYRNEDGAGGGDGGAGGAPNPADGGGADDIAAQIAALQAERDSLLAKNNELLGETKKAKAARIEAERLAAEQERAKAEAEGNYQQLYESSEKHRKTLQEQLEGLTGSIQQKEVKTAALRLASELAEGANIELLSEFVTRRLKYSDDGVKVTDETGNLTVSTLDDLKKEFAGSARYASLIKGNQASGGGATGGSSSGGAAKVMTRAEFDALDPKARMEKMRAGFKIT